MRLAALGLILVFAAAPAVAQEGRTFPERLPLDTPQSTASAFVAAFEAGDYFAAYYMLSSEARGAYLGQYYLLDMGRYFHLGDSPFIEGSILSGDLERVPEEMLDEFVNDPALTFDNITFHAAANGQMPFSLDGAVVGAVTPDGEDRATVAVALAGPPEELEFQMLRAHSGDWKVDRITWPGSSVEMRPWGLPEPKIKGSP